MNPQAPHPGLRRAAAAMALVLALAAAQAVQAAGPGVHGRVFSLDESGKLAGVVPGAKIEFKSQGGTPIQSVTAAQNGYYRLDLPPGHYYFKVTADGYKDEDSGRGLALELSDGYAVYNFSLTRGKTDPERTTPEFETVEEGKLHGRVMERKADGSLVGVPRAQVALRRHGARRLTRVATRGSGSIAQQAGQYAVLLEAGSWQASVVAPGFDTLVDRRPIFIQTGRSTQRDFILTRPGPDTADEQETQEQGIKGRITLKGKPAGVQATPQVKVQILPLSRSSRRPEPFSPGGDGGYRRQLPVGRYQVTAAADGYRPARSGPCDVFAGRYTMVNLTLVAKPEDKPPVETPALDCLVFEQSRHGKRPLPGAVVMVRKTGSSLGQALRDTSDRQGQARFDSIGAGQYTVLAQKPGYQPNGVHVEVQAGARNQATILLVQKPSDTPGNQPGQDQPERDRPVAQSVIVRGYVMARSDDKRTTFKPLPNVVTVWAHGGWSPSNATSSPRGDFTLSLKPTTYTVYVKAPQGYQPKEQKVEVRQGMKPVYLVLDPVAMTIPDRRVPDRLHDLFDRRDQGPETAGAGSRDSQKMVALNLRVFERVAMKPTRPIAGALVFVEQNGKRTASGQTDSQGTASFKLAPGACRVYAKHQAYGGTYGDARLGGSPTSLTLYLDKPAGSQPDRIDPRGTDEKPPRVLPIDPRASMRESFQRKPESQRQTKPQGSTTPMVIPGAFLRKPEPQRQLPAQGAATQRTSVQTLTRLPLQEKPSSRQSEASTKPDKKDEAKQPTTVNPALIRQLLESRRAAAQKPEAQPGPY